MGFQQSLCFRKMKLRFKKIEKSISEILNKQECSCQCKNEERGKYEEGKFIQSARIPSR